MSDKAGNSSIIKDAAILFLITLVAALLLSLANEVTKGPIAEQEAKAKAEAYHMVFGPAEKIDMEDKVLADKLAASEELLSEASLSKVKIEEAGIAKDKAGNTIGYVMTITSHSGYGGDITITMGYTADKKVTNIEFLTLNETVGFGQNAKEPSYMEQYAGISGEALLVPAGEEAGAASIEGISGATITSSAVLDAVNAGILFANDLLDSFDGGAK